MFGNVLFWSVLFLMFKSSGFRCMVPFFSWPLFPCHKQRHHHKLPQLRIAFLYLRNKSSQQPTDGGLCCTKCLGWYFNTITVGVSFFGKNWFYKTLNTKWASPDPRPSLGLGFICVFGWAWIRHLREGICVSRSQNGSSVFQSRDHSFCNIHLYHGWPAYKTPVLFFNL